NLSAKLLLFIYFIAFLTLLSVILSLIQFDYAFIRYGIAFLSLSLFLFYFISIRYQNILLKVQETIEQSQYKKPLTEDEKKFIQQNLKDLMEEDFFLKNDLTLKELSEEIGVSVNQLSQYLNEHEKCNFNTYINRFRIEKACKLLSDSERSAISIAYEVGYNNYTTFQIAFKKIKGVSPNQYRKKIP
ncbi:MAG: AraC family transcriptional regulator, partial [Candidatus Hydrogenedentota bacterium]